MAQGKKKLALTVARNREPKTAPQQKPPTKDPFDWIRSFAKNAVVVSVIVALLTIGSTLIQSNGKFVILPFEIKGDGAISQDLGDQFSNGLYTTFTELNKIYNTNSGDSIGKKLSSKLLSNIISAALTNIPLSEIPKSSSISRAVLSTTIEFGSIKIPIGKWVFENFSFIHPDYLKGSIESWNGVILVRASVNNGEPFVIVDEKKNGFRWLMDTTAAEVLNQKGWIEGAKTNRSALMYFSRGLASYISYVKSGEAHDIEDAKANFRESVSSDPDFSLATLDLAVTQHLSWKPEELSSSMKNFARLLDNSEFKQKAEIGFVAATLHYLERAHDCATYARLLGNAKNMIDLYVSKAHNPDPDAYALRGAINGKFFEAKMNNYECSGNAPIKFAEYEKVMDGLEGAFSDYKTAAALLESEKTTDNAQKIEQRNLLLSLRKKYLRDDEAELAISGHKFDVALSKLRDALGVIKNISDKFKLLPQRDVAIAFPYLKGSFAQTYLEYARVKEHSGDNQNDIMSIDDAINASEKYYKEMAYGPDPKATQWALGRLADLEFSRGKIQEAVDALNEYAAIATADNSKQFLFDRPAYINGLVFGDRKTICKAISALEEAADPSGGPVFRDVVLSELYRETGLYKKSELILKAAKNILDNSLLWYGKLPSKKVELDEMLTLALEKDVQTAGNGASQFREIQAYLGGGEPAGTQPRFGAIKEENNFLLLDVLQLDRLLSRPSRLQAARAAIRSAAPDLEGLAKYSLNLGVRCPEAKGRVQ